MGIVVSQQLRLSAILCCSSVKNPKTTTSLLSKLIFSPDSLKTQEQELKIDDVEGHHLHHNHGVIGILEVGDPTARDQMSNYVQEVSGPLILTQNTC